jgi:hypothetical protein
MPKRSLKSRVPVSTAGNPSPEKASQASPERVASAVIGFNKGHEARLITSLVEYYGWTLCTDGNLYNPNGGSIAVGSLAA